MILFRFDLTHESLLEYDYWLVNDTTRVAITSLTLCPDRN